MHSFCMKLATAASVLASLASAGFDKDSRNNVAVYWGQNFASGSQQRLSAYCGSTQLDIIPVAFLTSLTNPTVNVANAGNNCTTFPGSQLLNCPQIEEDIKTCQSKYGKTVMLSIGGETYQEGGFPSESAAKTAAETVWNLFGPNTKTANRPFGSAVIDGFDFDFESKTQNMVPFAQRLRGLMDDASAKSNKKFYLSAAPQCPFPDMADGDMLAGEIAFDFVMVQFYNNFCGVQNFVAGGAAGNAVGGGSARRQQAAFNFAAWDAWARGKPLDGSRGSKNPDVKILLGVPASKSAAGTGFVEAAMLRPIVEFCASSFPSFGGVMMWDMSHLFSGGGGGDSPVVGSFLEEVHGALSLVTSAVTNGKNRVNHANGTAAAAPASNTTSNTNGSSSSSSINDSSNGSGGSAPLSSDSTSYYLSSTIMSWPGLALGVLFYSLV
ncbi:Branchpoint-bridging protein [Apiospora arundinis]